MTFAQGAPLMRSTLLSSVLAGCLVAVLAAPAAAAPKTTRVEGVCLIPAKEASFKGRVLEVRLYRHDPEIADRPATLVDKVLVRNLSHTRGIRTRKKFVIGSKG